MVLYIGLKKIPFLSHKICLPTNNLTHMCMVVMLFNRPVVSDFLQPQNSRPPCPSPSPWVCRSSCSLHPWCWSAVSSSDALWCPEPFPASGIFHWVICSHQMTKILKLQLQHQSFQWIFRVDFPSLKIGWFDLLVVQGTFRSLLQHHSPRVSALCGLLSLW